MATTIDQYKIKLSVEGQQAVDTLRNSISGLGSTLAGIGFAAFITSAFKMADAMDDVAKSTGLTIGFVNALSQSLEEAGGNFEDAGKIINVFFGTLDEAAKGSEKAQDALSKVGIKLNDLSRLSEQELLQKAINNLGDMQAGATRTALAVDVFGKAIKSVDPKALEEALATKDITKLQEEMSKAAEVVGNLEASFRELQMAALRLLTPLIGEVDNFKITAEQAETIVKTLGITMGIVFGAPIVASIVTITGAVTRLAAAMSAASVASGGMLKGIGKAFALAALAEGLFYTSEEDMKILRDAENAKKGITPNAPTGAGGGRGFVNPSMVTPGGGTSKAAFDASQVSKYTKEELDARLKAGVAAKAQTDQLRLQNTEAQKYLRTVISTMDQDEIAGNLKRDLVQMESDAKIKIADLTKQIAVEETNRRGPNEEVINQLKAQVVEVNKNFEVTKKLKEQEAAKLSLLEQQRLSMARSVEYMQTMASIESEISKAYLQRVVAYGAGTEEQKKMTVDFMGLQTEAAVKIATLKKKLENETNESERKDLQTRIKFEEEYYKKRGKLLELQYENEKAMRESSIAGSKAAFEQISRSMDPYMIAQQKTNQLWSNMSSAIDNFVDNGKFSFSDFAESVIKDLIKIEMKAAAMNLWKVMSGAGGGGGGGGGGFDLGSLVQTGLSFLGFASGGSPPLDRPSIVGEKGPELFIPRTAGTIVPNNAMGGTPVQNTYVTNNISAIDGASIARLFTQNRQLLLGTIEQAKKELPMSLARGR